MPNEVTETESGTLAMEIQDAGGNVIIEKEDAGTGCFDVEVSGTVSIRLQADQHKSSFLIE